MLTISTPSGAIVDSGTTAWDLYDALWKADLCAAHGPLAADGVRALCGSVWRQLQGEELQLQGPVPVHGLRTADVSGEPAGHRGVFALADREALPHGYPQSGLAQYAGQCERDARLAHLRRLRATADRCRSQAVHQRARWYRSGQHGIRPGSTTIDLSLSLFPWAPFRTTKAAVFTLLDLRDSIGFIHISDGKLHDVNILDQLIPEAGAFYVMDRGYIDYQRACTGCIRREVSL